MIIGRTVGELTANKLLVLYSDWSAERPCEGLRGSGCRRFIGELLARLVIKELGRKATIVRTINKRGDAVYIDYLQNRHGQLIVAPFSVRPLPGATVSMPLTWDEVNDDLDPKHHTIRNALERMESMGTDPVRPVLTEKPKLAKILARLDAMLKG